MLLAYSSGSHTLSLCAAGSSDVYSMPEGKSSLPKSGEAPTYVNTQHIDAQVLAALQGEPEASPEGGAGAANKDSPQKDMFDMSKCLASPAAAIDLA